MSKKKTEYERLKEVWYKRLKDDGFKDIEHDDNSINIGIPRSIQGKDDVLRQSVQDYYCMAYHFLNEYEFDSELDKIMWEYHTNGLSARNISRLLKQTKVSTISRDRVWVKLRKLENIMKGLYLSI